jgi:septum formation protein
MTLTNKVYLASKSPRRRELIAQVFKNIEFLDAPLEEPRWKPGQNPTEYLKICLEEKMRVGRAALRKPDNHSFLIVADTIVVLGKKVLGKPSSPADAAKMLGELSGKMHVVPTGVQLAYSKNGTWKIESRIVESRVKFRKLTALEIKNYVKSGEPMDKAGAYGFQAKGLQLVESIEGSYSNIIGLPVDTLREMALKMVKESSPPESL